MSTQAEHKAAGGGADRAIRPTAVNGVSADVQLALVHAMLATIPDPA